MSWKKHIHQNHRATEPPGDSQSTGRRWDTFLMCVFEMPEVPDIRPPSGTAHTCKSYPPPCQPEFWKIIRRPCGPAVVVEAVSSLNRGSAILRHRSSCSRRCLTCGLPGRDCDSRGGTREHRKGQIEHKRACTKNGYGGDWGSPGSLFPVGRDPASEHGGSVNTNLTIGAERARNQDLHLRKTTQSHENPHKLRDSAPT